MSNKGYFSVSRDTDNPRDIFFGQIELQPEETIPEDQLKLRDDVDATLTTLRMLFPKGAAASGTATSEKFEEYFRSLLSLAQLGLSGDSANPTLASHALASLRNDILTREGGRVKNRYMRKLGAMAALSALPVLIAALVIGVYLPQLGVLRGFLFLWVGSMAGVWLSFGARRFELKFEELGVLEQDRLSPSIRLIFAGMLTLVIGLLVSTQAMNLQLGSLTTTEFSKNIEVALLIGVLCGFSEKILSTKIAQQAGQFIGAKS